MAGRNNANQNKNNEFSWTAIAAGVGALVGGGIYLYNRFTSNAQSSTSHETTQQYSAGNPCFSGHGGTVYGESKRGIDEDKIPKYPTVTNLNSLLDDIYKRYVALKRNDFELHYKVFDKIFQHLHREMKKVDPYYEKYSSRVQFAGSHYDRLRINKPDEFDMDIVISLPLNIYDNPKNNKESDIIIEANTAGHLQLKMGVQFQKLPMRDRDEWEINKAAYKWKDSNDYLLRTKFMYWFKGVVDKALNNFASDEYGRPVYMVENTRYIIDKSESGPAVTLIIKNEAKRFKLDVDLVPALKFPEERWPIAKGYRDIPSECKKGVWLIVGKPSKKAQNVYESSRMWRVALHDQERELMHDSYNLRQALRLIKKLRDAQGMNEIASYYIKTLFYWEIVSKNDRSYWMKNSPATIFKLMISKFLYALESRSIPYFWNKNNNLIGHVPSNTLTHYARILTKFNYVLNFSDYKLVAPYLLTPIEFSEYKNICTFK